MNVKCPICHQVNIKQEGMEIICASCGCVLKGPLPIYVDGRKVHYPWGVEF